VSLFHHPYAPERITCPTCGGDGEFDHVVGHDPNGPVVQWYKCRECEGEGSIAPPDGHVWRLCRACEGDRGHNVPDFYDRETGWSPGGWAECESCHERGYIAVRLASHIEDAPAVEDEEIPF
jgi:hypothetical protein